MVLLVSNIFLFSTQAAIIGSYRDSTGYEHGFITNGATFTPINYPGSVATTPFGINDNGPIVGSYMSPTASGEHGFIFNGTTFTTLDYSYYTTRLLDINNSGQIVGFYSLEGVNHSFLLNAGTFTSISYPGAAWTVTSGINDSGSL
jgi:hypothetical protein